MQTLSESLCGIYSPPLDAETYKVYVAVSVCFSVKAVHLELDGFVARRGLPAEMISDCGINFIGANKQLQKLINSSTGQTALLDARPMCKWNFNPHQCFPFWQTLGSGCPLG